MLKIDKTNNLKEILIPFVTTSYPNHINKTYLKHSILHNHSGISIQDDTISKIIESNKNTPPPLPLMAAVKK